MDPSQQDRLEQLLLSYFGDQSVAAGVRELVFVTRQGEHLHDRYRKTLTDAVAAAEAGDPDLLATVRRRFAPLMTDTAAATVLVSDILEAYDAAYAAAIEATGRAGL